MIFDGKLALFPLLFQCYSNHHSNNTEIVCSLEEIQRDREQLVLLHKATCQFKTTQMAGCRYYL